MSLASGTRLGHYEIVDALGAGGMGEVYRARDPRLGRDVAIKVLSSQFSADPDFLRRFEQEARAAAALNHPNILAVHDIGSRDGSPYIVSELLSGETLRTRLAGGALAVPKAIDYAAQIAHGLAAAHEKGIVHRDLKPENIFITDDGRVKILDFGLAKLMVPEGGTPENATDTPTAASPTRAGTVLGTAGYMSPEQVRGETADHRSDIFSFGAVLYEMLASRRAFAGRSAADAMSAILRDDPPEPSAADRLLPAALQRVVRRCLEKRAADRFQSARDLAFALTGMSGIADAPVSEVRAPAHASRRIWWAAAALVALALVLAVGLTDLSRMIRGGDPDPRIGSLAVLPLRNLSNDPEQEYFADGMTEALIGDLARMGGVRVISRTSSMTYKSGQPTLPEIADQLHVDAVVEGSVSRSGDRVRIAVQLIDARTDHSLWTNTYERDLRDVLALQAEVARAIAQEIKVTLTPQEEARLTATPPVNRDAYEAYLRGRYFLARPTEEGLNKAIESFNQAIEKDPGYAKPYAGLADAYTLLRSIYLPPDLVMPKAKAAAARALQLDPALAEAHLSMGGVLMYYDFDWTGAERELKRAIELSPNLAEAHEYYALYLAALGRHAEARTEINRAAELDPLSLMIMVDDGFVHYLAREYEQAAEANRKALEIDPNFWPAQRDLGLAYEKLGRFPEAIAALEKARQLDSNPSILEMLGGAYASWGKKDEARKVLKEMTALASRRYVCPYEVATVYADLGDKKATLEWLEKGLKERADCMPWARSDPKLDTMRGHPGFVDLMQRFGMPR